MKAFHHLVNRRPGHQAIDRLVPHHHVDLRFLKDPHRLLDRSLSGQLLLRRPSETEIITNSNANKPAVKPAIMPSNGRIPVKNKNEMAIKEPNLEPKAAQSDFP